MAASYLTVPLVDGVDEKVAAHQHDRNANEKRNQKHRHLSLLRFVPVSQGKRFSDAAVA